jgi:hypothetical protein
VVFRKILSIGIEFQETSLGPPQYEYWTGYSNKLISKNWPVNGFKTEDEDYQSLIKQYIKEP